MNSFDEIEKKLNQVFNNRRFVSNLNNIKVNWLDVSSKEVIDCILEFIQTFIQVRV